MAEETRKGAGKTIRRIDSPDSMDTSPAPLAERCDDLRMATAPVQGSWGSAWEYASAWSGSSIA